MCTHQNREDQLDTSDKIAAEKRTWFFLWMGRECENNGHDVYLNYVFYLVEQIFDYFSKEQLIYHKLHAV